MKTRLLFYNPGIRDRNIGVPEVQDVELETVCLAGDCIETPGTAYAVPKKVGCGRAERAVTEYTDGETYWRTSAAAGLDGT